MKINFAAMNGLTLLSNDWAAEDAEGAEEYSREVSWQ